MNEEGPVENWISASEAADILSKKLGRPIKPGYIYKISGIRSRKIDAHRYLYWRADVQAAYVRKHKNDDE